MWTVDETTFDPARQRAGETLMTVGNGYLCTRGTFEEGLPGQWRTTFLHGVFDAVPIAFTEIANVPDWTAAVVVVDGEVFGMDAGTVQDYHRSLDLRTAELTRSLRWVASSGAAARLEFRRFASLADEHLAAVQVRVTPEQDCTVEIRVPVLSEVGNVSEGKYRVGHTEHVETLADGDDVAGALVGTVDGRYEVALAVRVSPLGEGASTARWAVPGATALTTTFAATAGATVGVDKVAAYQTSRDGEDDVAAAAVRRVRQAGGIDALATASATRWAQDWQTCDIEIDGADDAQLAVRFNLYHLLIAAPRHDDDVNIGAKTLSGFGYRGHCFWDTEIFMLPVFTYTLPRVARNLLDYRWHRLQAAHGKAAAGGHEGARFPWESADTGDEVTPPFAPDAADPTRLVRIWTGDIQIHISADVAYAALQYWNVSGDDAWFAGHGAELVLDTAKYYASAAEEDADGTFHYRQVIGPDEYHEHVDDNAFTNALARWTIRTGLRTLDWLRTEQPARAAELVAALDLDETRLARWTTVADGIVVPMREDGLVPQFAGFLDLEDVDLAAYEPRTRSMQAILGIDGANERQVLKQPDVVLMMLLLEDEFSDEQRRVNYDYYTPRTDHVYGSSLGPAMQAIIAARAGLADDALEHFERAAFAALRDVRGNVADGVHAASCGGVWQAVALGFAGLKIHDDGRVTTHPRLPQGWTRLSFGIEVRGEPQRITIRADATS